MKLPPGNMGNRISEPLKKKKHFPRPPQEACDPPSFAYLNGKTMLRPCTPEEELRVIIYDAMKAICSHCPSCRTKAYDTSGCRLLIKVFIWTKPMASRNTDPKTGEST